MQQGLNFPLSRLESFSNEHCARIDTATACANVQTLPQD